MSTFEITAVRTERSDVGHHDHISHVGIGPRREVLSRQTVVDNIKNPVGDRYFTLAGARRAQVVVVSCPSCTFRDYLRTDADSTTSNNLLSLPRI